MVLRRIKIQREGQFEFLILGYTEINELFLIHFLKTLVELNKLARKNN